MGGLGMTGKENEQVGSFEEVVLIAVQHLGKGAYGASIHEALVEVGRGVSIGSLYVTLGRLEDKGLLESWQGEPTAERGGRAKKFFRITGTGERALREAQNIRISLMSLKNLGVSYV